MIETKEQYMKQALLGKSPLLSDDIAHGLRVEIQRENFGRGHTPAENGKFYRWVWAAKPHLCEECLKRLPHYNATFVSHILSRGAHPDMAHDPRNTNILCKSCHDKWENGNRQEMRIYAKNQRTIIKLKQEYEFQTTICD